MPRDVTPNYLATVLGDMSPDSARQNVLRPLRAVGLVGDDNKPTERATRWRDDSQYASVCEEIRSEVYPQELHDAFSGPDIDEAGVQAWFVRHTGGGTEAARKAARFYVLLSKADPNAESDAQTPARTARSATTTPTKRTPRTRPAADTTSQQQAPAAADNRQDEALHLAKQSADSGLALHIDVQIHISPDASSDQIDQIFASMAKHLPLGRQRPE